MTENKSIMIDGVDVSGCNFTLERDGKIKCECCHATGFGVICDCESWKTCDYKNYTRKTQECEELKNIINEAQNSGLDFKSFLLSEAIQEEYEEQIDQLKAENEELKKKKEENETFYLKKYANRDSDCLELEHKLKQAEQKLERIREVAKQMSNECFYDDFDCKDCDMKNGCTYLNKSKILQIIDEVE